jgi:hypothetical protein
MYTLELVALETHASIAAPCQPSSDRLKLVHIFVFGLTSLHLITIFMILY